MDSEQTKLDHALNDPQVTFALKYLHSSIEACAEESTPKTLELCAAYIGAFITRMLFNQLIFDAGSIANEIQYYSTKFIVDFTMLEKDGGGEVE